MGDAICLGGVGRFVKFYRVPPASERYEAVYGFRDRARVTLYVRIEYYDLRRIIQLRHLRGLEPENRALEACGELVDVRYHGRLRIVRVRYCGREYRVFPALRPICLLPEYARLFLRELGRDRRVSRVLREAIVFFGAERNL